MLTASALTAHARETCNPDSFSNPDLIICGQQSFEKVDALLNEQYKKALVSLSPAEQLQLKDVQKKWVRFKEGFCEGVYQGTFPGAEAPIDRLGCLVQTSNARLGELVALQTGLPLDGFYKAASAMAGQDREKGLATSMERLGGADFDEPLWKQYADGHCEMAVELFREDFANCIIRMRFQLPLNRLRV
jgi:uncharacterized protein YecT (DUF1311 family)